MGVSGEQAAANRARRDSRLEDLFKSPLISPRGPEFLQLGALWDRVRRWLFETEEALFPVHFVRQVRALRASMVLQARGQATRNHAACTAN